MKKEKKQEMEMKMTMTKMMMMIIKMDKLEKKVKKTVAMSRTE